MNKQTQTHARRKNVNRVKDITILTAGWFLCFISVADSEREHSYSYLIDW